MSDPHVIEDDGTGTPRRMGRLLPRGPMALRQFRTYHEPIPARDWEPIDMLGSFDPPVLDQLETNSCVGHSAVTAFSLLWAMQGFDPVRFSPCYVYGQLNGGLDGGASIGDTIRAMETKGVCLESTVPEGMIYASQFPPEADAEAANYKLIEAYQITGSPDEVCADVATAIQMGYAGVLSVMVGRRFNKLNWQALAGVDSGPGNHAVAVAGMVPLAHGAWAYKLQNSWSSDWGDQGRFLATDDHIRSQSYFEAVIFRAVTGGPEPPAYR